MKQASKPASEEEEEETDSSEKKAVPKALLLSASSSSSSERKVVSQTPSSRSNPVSSGAPAGFLLQCHIATVGIANLALGYTAGSEEKLAKILQILGTDEVMD